LKWMSKAAKSLKDDGEFARFLEQDIKKTKNKLAETHTKLEQQLKSMTTIKKGAIVKITADCNLGDSKNNKNGADFYRVAANTMANVIEVRPDGTYDIKIQSGNQKGKTVQAFLLDVVLDKDALILKQSPFGPEINDENYDTNSPRMMQRETNDLDFEIAEHKKGKADFIQVDSMSSVFEDYRRNPSPDMSDLSRMSLISPDEEGSLQNAVIENYSRKFFFEQGIAQKNADLHAIKGYKKLVEEVMWTFELLFKYRTFDLAIAALRTLKPTVSEDIERKNKQIGRLEAASKKEWKYWENRGTDWGRGGNQTLGNSMSQL